MDIPNISKSAFWDINMSDLDFEKHKEYIFIKILNHGSFDDIVKIYKYYGPEEIKALLLKSNGLIDSGKTMASLISNVINNAI